MELTHSKRERLSAVLIGSLMIGSVPALSGTAYASSVHLSLRTTGTINLSTAAGVAGTATTLNGSGFDQANGVVTPTVSLKFKDAAGTVTTLPQTTTTSALGAFSLGSGAPALAVAGPGVFTVTDSGGATGVAAFDVRPVSTTLVASPASGLQGSTETVTGTGFAANAPLTLVFTQGTVTSTLVSSVITSTDLGHFTTSLVIPAGATAGSATITARDDDANSATAAYTVTRQGAPLVSVAPSVLNAGGSVTITGTNFAVSHPLTLTLTQGSNSYALNTGKVQSDATGAFTVSADVPTTVVTGTAVLTATDGAGNTATETLQAYPAQSVTNGPSSIYFAEGYTGQYSTNGRASYTETISILNANPFTATAQIEYLVQGGSPAFVTRQIAPQSTYRELVNSDVGPDKTVAAIVTSTSKLTAERIIERSGVNKARLAASSSQGNAALGKSFYFAEGYTGISFQEYVTLANPNAITANVTIQFAPEAATSKGALSETFAVPADGRLTRNIRLDGRFFKNKSVGMIITSDQPIMAERVLYFGDGNGSAKFGATAKAGVQTVGNQYLFGYGSAGGVGSSQNAGDQSYVTVLNPGTSPLPATILAQFFDASGKPLGTTTVSVAPGTRQTIDANLVARHTALIYSVILTSASPFVAEKPQYYSGNPNIGQHPGISPSGVMAGVTNASFPNVDVVTTMGLTETQNVFLYNPGTTAITVAGTYYSPTATKIVQYAIPAGGILPVNVNSDAAGLSSSTLGVIFAVTSTGANDAFVATSVGYTYDRKSYVGSQGI